jgi:hypothetical protein
MDIAKRVFRLHPPPGTLRAHNGADLSKAAFAAGRSYMRPAGITHDVMNGSDHPIAFVEIEVKEPGKLVMLPEV